MKNEEILKELNKQILQFEIAGNKKQFVRLSHFRRSVYGIRICFEIMRLFLDQKQTNVECTKEYLTKSMANLASRATIINFLNDEIGCGSLETEVSLNDKRLKIIKPSSELLQEFKAWLDCAEKAA